MQLVCSASHTSEFTNWPTKDPRDKPARRGRRPPARALIEARTRAGLSQTQLARRTKTSQSYVARIEGGQVGPSTAALERLAKATGSRLTITFERAVAR